MNMHLINKLNNLQGITDTEKEMVSKILIRLNAGENEIYIKSKLREFQYSNFLPQDVKSAAANLWTWMDD